MPADTQASAARRGDPLNVAVLAVLGVVAQSPLPSEASVRAIVEDRVGSGQVTGLIVGLVDRAAHRLVAAAGSSGTGRPLDAHTVFEIGSVTKVFTAAALSEMVQRGEVTLQDPAQRYLPEGVTMPTGSRPITLLDLAMQRSGLPRLPSNLNPANLRNPYADYTTEQLYAFLSGYHLTRDPGAQYEYSNLGFGLLGDLLARAVGTDYETLLRRLVLAPLGMDETAITLSGALADRLTSGHTVDLQPAENWDMGALQGAGALRSTVNDMLSFLHANLDSRASPLGTALASTHVERADAGGENLTIGMAWHILLRPEGHIVWHNGETGGYHSFAGFDAAKGIAVVVLTNTASNIDDIGIHLLDPEFPVASPSRAAVVVDATTLESYVGVYAVTPAFAITITHEGDALFLQATNQPKFRLYASSDSTFFLRAVAATISFQRDSAHTVTSLVLHQNGRDIPAPRQP